MTVVLALLMKIVVHVKKVSPCADTCPCPSTHSWSLRMEKTVFVLAHIVLGVGLAGRYYACSESEPSHGGESVEFERMPQNTS
jgi:hypothetical protein